MKTVQVMISSPSSETVKDEVIAAVDVILDGAGKASHAAEIIRDGNGKVIAVNVNLPDEAAATAANAINQNRGVSMTDQVPLPPVTVFYSDLDKLLEDMGWINQQGWGYQIIDGNLVISGAQVIDTELFSVRGVPSVVGIGGTETVWETSFKLKDGAFKLTMYDGVNMSRTGILQNVPSMPAPWFGKTLLLVESPDSPPEGWTKNGPLYKELLNFDSNAYHTLKMVFNGIKINAYLDGVLLTGEGFTPVSNTSQNRLNLSSQGWDNIAMSIDWMAIKQYEPTV